MKQNNSYAIPAPAVEASKTRVVDRHNQSVGTLADSEPSLPGAIEIEIPEPMRQALDLEDKLLRVPRECVAGVRRNEIRLSVGLGDPALKAGTTPAP